MVYTQLAEEAIKAKLKAHPPYSNFHVGAALLTENNKLYLGANIENSSYSLTICAERTAVFNAYLEGERKFKAMAIASDAPDFCPPCGACRQVISDLCGNIDVIMVNHKKEIKVLKLSDLLPFAFGDENLR
ncbi:MAG: cytidine deaminase [Ignavibacteria bacterium RIFOXYB2_FULL_35_12]|nr:MAG: cytidine deaminase [Ignavibacteria bacterium GWF2_35_20]OGU78009.1 MAG: cytidine deaminase [Ignavibacteria bacterium RIFOXYA2_FULL_35_9]OGU87111.1 MAG: cytidine deaminase [Ignavibacteria bacterium RIFOXYA12_FULL_35_25]OGU92426.1 MAG: cytidine deaminase [Ignavibacteria bacterium RIFOXYC12_FULL_35_11]OGU95803.1 MAG: cytidine deaminase [Ignavibacteria bacterium RIFOXYB12_FULL_35_14]OGV00959.1 MAG: cytidine deaminase [Ignavibacteria bacterium RIFOXYC2_FULL_35_16]OGV05451.1 MAG: cytidine d